MDNGKTNPDTLDTAFQEHLRHKRHRRIRQERAREAARNAAGSTNPAPAATSQAECAYRRMMIEHGLLVTPGGCLNRTAYPALARLVNSLRRKGGAA